ncbi:MAG: segregation/condensation protein A [Clostridia bacterium]|nr:segregation/condensation protein A [Clostridia bacterium]
MEELKYRLDQFEGPLDLLLTLVEKNKINIDDIPISLLCAQYMEYIEAAEKMDIEISAEFIVMASELMLIKSKMLLPRNEETDEDPRAALAAAMLEYQRTKEASVSLNRMFAQYGSRMIKDTDEIKADNAYVADHDVELLTRAMIRMLTEVRVTDEEAIRQFEPLIKRKTVTVASVATVLMDTLKVGTPVTLNQYFASARKNRSTAIAMFMAMLELLKAGCVLLLESDYSSEGVISADDSAAICLNPESDVESISKILKDSANS